MSRTTRVRRSITLLAISGALVGGGLAAAPQAQAANVRVGVTSVLSHIAYTDVDIRDRGVGYAACVEAFPNKKIIGARLQRINPTGEHHGTASINIYWIACWGR